MSNMFEILGKISLKILAFPYCVFGGYTYDSKMRADWIG